MLWRSWWRKSVFFFSLLDCLRRKNFHSEEPCSAVILFISIFLLFMLRTSTLGLKKMKMGLLGSFFPWIWRILIIWLPLENRVSRTSKYIPYSHFMYHISRISWRMAKYQTTQWLSYLFWKYEPLCQVFQYISRICWASI